MRSSRERNIPNAFSSSFLEAFLERDEPPTAGEADLAGPWRIEEAAGPLTLERCGAILDERVAGEE